MYSIHQLYEVTLEQHITCINNKQNSSQGGANLSDDCNKPVSALPSAEVSVSMYSTSSPEPPPHVRICRKVL